MYCPTSLYYFFYFTVIAVLMAFYPLVMGAYGLTAAEISSVSLAAHISLTIGASASLYLTDYFKSIRRLSLVLAATIVFSFSLLFQQQNFFSIILTISVFAFCLKGLNTLVEAQAVRDSFEGSSNFERKRMWGSVGFVAAMFGFGVLVDTYGLDLIIPIATILLAPLAFLSLMIFRTETESSLNHQLEKPASKPANGGEEWKSNFYWLTLSVAFMWASHATWDTYFSVYLEELQWSATAIAAAFVVGVISEITVFLLFPRLEKALSLPRIYQISTLLAVLRWLILSSYASTEALLFTQVLHGFTFGAHFLCTVKFVYMLLPNQLRNKGQGWIATFGSGAGMILGKATVSAFAINLSSYKDLTPFFIVSSVVAALSWLSFHQIAHSSQD